jgi:hypothetical protein
MIEGHISLYDSGGYPSLLDLILNLKDLFAERFERSFDKIGVAIHIAQGMSNLAPDALARLHALVDQLCRSAAAI